jgi:F like protein
VGSVVAVDWAAEREERGRRLAAIERLLFESWRPVMEETLAVIRPRVLLAGDRVDPRGAFAGAQVYEREASRWVDEDLRDVAEAAAHEQFDGDLIKDSDAAIAEYLDGAKNRLAGVPDRVYDRVKALAQGAIDAGDPNEELAARIDELFSEEGIASWDGRAMVIARTEAIAAHNAGTYAGFLSMAEFDPQPWEKAWLATADTRTRETHRRADQQRVKLGAQFRVGRARLLYPGDPSGPPEEVIQCRCTLLMLEPGEEIDLTNRQFLDGDE